MIPPLHRWLPSATILLLALVVGCAQAQQSPPDLDCDNPFAAVGGAPDFDMSHWSTDFCEHSVPYSEIISGGPPPDGIPPIDNPAYTDIASADDWIANDEPVIALDVNGDARAYPLQILTWHEIVNDTIGGTPVAVTFCPLCYAAVTFVRPEIDGERLTFGTTGNLRHSDMVMWDRQTESWWQQFTGEGIVGDLTGETLESIPAPMISWAEFKETHPEGQVLSRDTGFNRRYGENPYVGYDDVNETPFLYRGAVGDQLPPMDELRDYRFYARDWAHPSEEAVDYIWQRFSSAVFEQNTKELNREIDALVRASRHRPQHPDTPAHRRFVEQQMERIRKMEQRHPQLDFSPEKSRLWHGGRNTAD